MKSGGNATKMHNNAAFAGIKCMSCHELNMSWYGVSGLLTRRADKHTSADRKIPNDCSNCHSFSGGFRAMVRPVMRGAAMAPDGARVLPTVQGTKPVRGTMGNKYEHLSSDAARCKSCHDGKSASGMPARHLMVQSQCDVCHRTTVWSPAQFNHSGITPNTCQACHNGLSASARPPGHFMTGRSCDSCHRTWAWKPVTYSHMSPNYRPTPDMITCVSCHVSNSEIIPRQARSLNRVKPVVGP